MNLKEFETLLSLPTAPFRETAVLTYAEKYCLRHKIPFFYDSSRNLVVGANSKKTYLAKTKIKSKEPLRFFIAHTDHPGFHGLEWLDGRKLRCRFHGGSPRENLEGSTLWLATAAGYLTHDARIVELTKPLIARGIDEFILELSEPLAPKIDAGEVFGGFSFRAPIFREGDIYYTKAADDLAGVFSILETARSLYARKSAASKNFLALLSRAEEVGFIGTIAHFEEGLLKKRSREVVVVSLEASRQLPGAEIGKGVIVRLGDRMTIFDTQYTACFAALATKVLKTAFQKRIMDGGSCEASAAAAYGLPVIGMSVPLGNYHNQNLEAGPDSRGAGLGGAAPEFIHVSDLEGMVRMCARVVQNGTLTFDSYAPTRAKFKKSLREYSKLLRLQ